MAQLNRNEKLLLWPRKKWLVLVAGLVVVILALIVTQFFDNSNYAKETAKTFEHNLTLKGAAKLCSTEDSGRGLDNRRPWYHALYKVAGNKDIASQILLDAAKQSGFTLKSIAPPNPEDNVFYEDRASVQSSHQRLKPGNVEFLTEIYGSKIFSGDSQLCTVKNATGGQTSETLIDITVNLPEYR